MLFGEKIFYKKVLCVELFSSTAGVFLLAVVSFLLNLAALTLPEFMVMSPLFDTDGLHFWLLILITTDVGLAIGSKTSNRVVLIPWLVAYMIHIVITCFIAPFILLAATEALRHARSVGNPQIVFISK